MADFDLDLQLFGEEGGGADGGGAENTPAAGGEQANVEGGQAQTETAGTADGKQETAGSEKPGTLLGGKEEETAWDFRGMVPEGMAYDEKSAAAFTTVAKEAGLTGAQAQKLAAYGMKYAQEGIAAMTRAFAEEVQGWADATRAELGSNFDATVQKAGTGIEALENVVPGIRQALNETGAGNRIEFVKAFALIGELVGEDNFRGFGTAAGVKSSHYPNTNFNNY